MNAMIISVGGTVEPVVTSILTHKPEYVCFYASQQSLEKIGEIKTQAQEKGCRVENYNIICDDVNDLIHCYQQALRCVEKLTEKGVGVRDVMVDYTGGTKTMTAALALATVGHGCSFSYVGGKERTKNGLGIVVTGTEVVTQDVSPWQIFAVEERKRISWFVGSFQYEAAISLMKDTMENLAPAECEVWKGICRLLEGYLAWDNFDHQTAMRTLGNGLKQMETCEKFGLSVPVQAFVERARENFDALDAINRQTQFFKKMHPELIRDLVSNARRRYLQNKYDDAVARLYRALEMAGQIAFEGVTGSSTSEADPEKLPESLRGEYLQRYKSPDDGIIRIPLYATFRVLKEMDHVLGHSFFQEEETFKDILYARNHSILAHGMNAVKRETYENFTKIIEALFVEGELIQFPGLDW